MFNGDQVWLEELIGPSSYSNSPGGSRESSSSSSLESWGSGATCILHSSIKKQSQEAFQTRLREEKIWEKSAACSSDGSDAWPETGGLGQGRGSALSHACATVQRQRQLDEKIEAKLKFSQFLDEVTSNVLDPNSLQAFGKQASPSSLVQPEAETHRPLCSMAQQLGSVTEQKKTQVKQTAPDTAEKTYLETDIDGRDEDPEFEIDEKNVIPPPPQFCQGFEMKSPSPEFQSDFPRYPYRSASLPRGINMVSDESCPSL